MPIAYFGSMYFIDLFLSTKNLISCSFINLLSCQLKTLVLSTKINN